MRYGTAIRSTNVRSRVLPFGENIVSVLDFELNVILGIPHGQKEEDYVQLKETEGQLVFL